MYNVNRLNAKGIPGNLSKEDEAGCAAEWPDKQTKLLIELYKSKKALVDMRKIKTLKKMWELMSDEMLTHDFNYTPQQCESKWKSLERAYKKTIQRKSKTGRGRRTCPFEKELSEILIKRHNMFPVCTMGTGSLTLHSEAIEESGAVTEMEEAAGGSSTEDPDDLVCRSAAFPLTSCDSLLTSTRAPRRQARARNVYHELKEIRKLIEKRGEEKIRLEERKLQQKDELIKQLAIKNELMKKFLQLQTKRSKNYDDFQ